ncbi:hypothetical protein [Hymenobacter sp. CRA2]|uniref:hypothetical protein n=1 Tax=Hymenobacter sp. CRA2 TaxID=1955620 RepID=UPI00098F28E9|nr:hypothetical protein [Hymenobacter sp. CRA2]OON67772.1 hypothetical protein B0919_16385 [Hymenobacter sp. CRA2]
MAKQDTKASKETFALPSSPYDELSRIIQSYARRGDNVSLADVARLSGLTEDTISRNNAFLTTSGLIAGGNAKSATDLGKRLGRALEHEQADDVRNCLAEMVQAVPFLTDLLSPARMKKGNTEAELVAHILYVADIPRTNTKKVTGAHAVVRILLEAGLLTDDNGTLRLQAGTPPQAEPVSSNGQAPPAEPAPQPSNAAQPTTSVPLTTAATTAGPFAIAINIQLELPASTDPTVYENLFKALKKHLLSGNE